ncbi:MAG: type I restriction endonuclease subunit R [candidate division WOR-3 bacterium]|nr:type I restriction endonuclease subunit R [candidate division WOR-3 bacterium]
MTKVITESEVELAVLDILKDLGYSILYGPDISEGGLFAERNYNEVVLVRRLKDALELINPDIPSYAIDEAIKKILRTESQNLIINNQLFHRMVTNGVPVEYKRNDGSIKHDVVWLFDFKNIENNEFLAVNQFTVIEERNNRRPDVVLFVNGLPIGLIELKNPADENATIWSAFNQFETYKQQIPSLFRFNEILVISDGWEARAGTLTSNKERFSPWKTIDSQKMPEHFSQLEVMLKGMLNKEVLLDLIRHFIVFEIDKDTKDGISKISKKLAIYHQYNAVNHAIKSTIRASAVSDSQVREKPEKYGLPSIREQPIGDKRAGVVWHTQGSGKSLIMVFFVGKLVLQPELENPTIILLTDRNDLDDQLFGTFSRCQELLRQEPKQAESREEIKELLKVSSGGIIFTTIQKFLPEIKGTKYPLLSERRNIIVIADEAHRSQYDFIDGFARHIRDALPNATFIGFTGTPIEKEDRSTPAVFGNYVDIYDIEQAINDKVTVPIYYESRLAKLELKPEERPHIDEDFEEVTEGEEREQKERLKTKWARLEKIVGAENRIKRVAEDIVQHWEKRLSVLDGKAMIVCMSRRICIDLHNEIIKLRPEWYHQDDDKGIIKIVMTGSATDPPQWQEHIRNKERRRAIGERMKDPSDPLKIVIVRDMWLTGFDVPSLHTMYIDKPMRGHSLMQAIARVNRVFKDKNGGLIVDYIGIAVDLQKAVAQYTESGGKGRPVFDQEEAVKVLLEQYEIIKAMFYGFDYTRFFQLDTNEKIQFLRDAMEHILKQENGKERFIINVRKLMLAFALSVPNEKALAIKDEVGLFQAIKSMMMKSTLISEREKGDIESAIKQILSKAIVSDRVIDIFAAAGLKKPDISILSDEFLAEIKGMPQKNLAFEVLKKILSDEIKIRFRKNIVEGRRFSELLEEAIRKYTNRTVETAQIIEELITLAKEIRESHKRGEKLNLSEEELAFYDALETNDSAVKILGDAVLRTIARELFETVRRNVTIDWTLRENVQAKLRVMVKRILRKYGYPPDKQQKATDTVLEQAHLICKEWVKV